MNKPILFVKLIFNATVSYYLIRKYQSLLIIPLFWLSYSFISKIISYPYRLSSCDDCYFCKVSNNFVENKLRYNIYLDYINTNKDFIIQLNNDIKDSESKISSSLNDYLNHIINQYKQ